MSEIAEVFTELFFGTGSWLGILLLLSIIIALTIKIKWGGVITLPIIIFLGIDYITNDLFWNGLIMFFSAIFILITIVKNR